MSDVVAVAETVAVAVASPEAEASEPVAAAAITKPALDDAPPPLVPAGASATEAEKVISSAEDAPR